MATGIGDTLRAARQRQSRTLAEAAAATRVRERFLACLEQEEFDAIGGEVYVKGFITSYARFLGLDPEPLLDAFRARTPARPGPGAEPTYRRMAPGVRPLPHRPAGAALLLLLFAAVIVGLVAVGLLGFGDDTVSGARLAAAGRDALRDAATPGTSL